MLIKVISYICLGFAALFLIMLAIILLQKLAGKSKKTRNQIFSLARLYGILGAVFLIAGVALIFLPKEHRAMKEFINDSSPVAVYKKEKKVANLPSRIYAVQDDYYIKTGKGDVYGHIGFPETKKGADGKKIKKTVYENGLIYQEVQAVAGGKDFLAVLYKDGKLYLEGSFEYLKYEKNDTEFKGKLIAENCSFIDGNSNNLMYVADGDLYTLGYNAFGQLGDGTERNRLEPTMILENVASVSVSATHTLAVDAYGNLYGFGDNSFSELGNRTTMDSEKPIKLMSGVKQAEAGQYFSVVLTKDGKVFTAGRNDVGQLGTDDYRDYATYKHILDGVMKITVGDHCSAALTYEGGLYVWGGNAAGQLTLSDEKVGAPKLIAKDIYDVAMGKRSMGIIRLDRDVELSGAARAEKEKPLWELYSLNAKLEEKDRFMETNEMVKKPEAP